MFWKQLANQTPRLGYTGSFDNVPFFFVFNLLADDVVMKLTDVLGFKGL